LRRTVRLDEEPWRIIYETATYCGLELGRVVSLTQALKVVLFLLKDQDWFRANRDSILAKAREITKEGESEEEISDRKRIPAMLDNAAVGAGRPAEP
jgi:hypothetical protein